MDDGTNGGVLCPMGGTKNHFGASGNYARSGNWLGFGCGGRGGEKKLQTNFYEV